MIRPLRLVALDMAPKATAVARTHARFGGPRLAVDTIPGTAGRPLHIQTNIIEIGIRRMCGVPDNGGPPRPEFKPDLVVMEGTFSRPGASDYQLHHLRGNVTQWLWRVGIPYVDVSPATVKVWATGSGATRGENKVTKDKVIAAVIATYGGLLSIPVDDNCCDAMALLTLGLAQYGQPLAEVAPKHRRALSAVAWPTL